MKTVPAIAVEESENEKTGHVSCTYTSQNSCPPDCPFIGSGCYAEMGLVGIQTRRLNRSAINRANMIAHAEAAVIRTLSGLRPLRLHVVGDCRTNRAASIVARAARQHTDKANKPVWTYTHAWRRVLRSAWDSVSVLASCETGADVRAARACGYATCITVQEHLDRKVYNLDGIKILPCPAQTTKTVQCLDCQLCWQDSFLKKQNLTIGFSIHGGQSTLFRIRKSLKKCRK